jgi:hypothetical protein
MTRVVLVAAAVFAISLSVLAVTPQFWENFTQDELLKGTLTRVSLNSDGKLFLAPSYESVYDTTQPYVFSMVRDKAGNIYVGTGHEGRVYKIDPQGKGTLYFQSKELDVFALALDSSDTLYAGTSPDGKVYKITGPNQSSEFCNPEDKYIWSMLFDDAGNLYVGTGVRGIVFKVDRSGKKTTFYDSDDNHIVSMARNSSGNILAGTSPGGLVLEITPQGKAFALLDSPMEEIRALTVDRFGTVFVLASSSKGLSASSSKPDTSAIETVGGALPIVTIQALAAIGEKSKDAKGSVTAPGGEKDSAGAKSSIYALSKDGSIETVYASKESMLYDLITRADGSLLVATGAKGRLLSIDSSKQVSVVTDSPEEQITRLVAANDTVWVAGSNQGRVYKLLPQRAENGTYESRALDAKTVAGWGKISWRPAGAAAAGLEISTRTGNTEKPDNSWSDWSAAYTTAAGQNVTSPRARYLQWRATFKRGSSPTSYDTLERVHIAYLQQNLRPQVVSITALPYGVALQKTPSIQIGTLNLTSASNEGNALNSPRERGKERQPLSPRQVLQPGAQAFNWKATDDNDDDLVYSIYFRGEGESDWKLLEKRLTDTFYTLDSAALPDGTYTIKVVASDADANPYGKALIGELVSKPFVISNSTPVIEVTGQKAQGKRLDAQFRTRVGTGRIATGEFSIDGGEWFLLFPVDGIADSQQEEYQFQTPELTTGEHVIGVRASDANGNTATSKIVVKIQ